MHIVQSVFTCTHELGQIREESLHGTSDVSCVQMCEQHVHSPSQCSTSSLFHTFTLQLNAPQFALKLNAQ